MKTRIALLTILCLTLAVIPARAQVLYDDGPINGNVNAWAISFGYIVSDTFTLVANSTVGGFNFGVWEYPGDRVFSADWSITQYIEGGTVYGSGTAVVANRFLFFNQYGFDIDELSVSGLNVPMNAGTYWLNLQNGVTKDGKAVYWDENSGVGCQSQGCPSEAWGNHEGQIPSESFSVLGSGNDTTPEPNNIVLFGSGVLGLAGLLRRKLF